MGVAQWLSTYSYGAVLLRVARESTSIPFPGETMLLVAAIVAGTAQQLDIFWVIAAAASRAVLSDQPGYWHGATEGTRLLLRHARVMFRIERKLKLGLALFQNHQLHRKRIGL